MEKEEISQMDSSREGVEELAQLLKAMKDSVEKMEGAKKENNSEDASSSMREILRLQKKINQII